MQKFNRHWGKWLLALALLLLLGGAVWRALEQRNAQLAALAKITASQAEASVVEIADSDLVQAQVLDISQGVALSGTLKALNFAFVKAEWPANCWV